MKTKLLLSILLSFSFYLLSSQIPQGFNYQAIARNGNDPIITTLQVKIGIQSDTLSTSYVWEEIHSSVKPNASGLFSLVVGKGTRESGTAATFGEIDWTKTPLFMKTSIYYGGSWKYMGSAQVWTVPYAMIAGALSGPVNKLDVLGKTHLMEESLFEVKNKDGQTIFAVYNEGVRIWVSDGAKGTKGGFAIGGFDKANASNEEYLRVTRDSTRIYLNDTETKGKKGGFAIGGFDNAYGLNASFLNVATDASGIINPSQNRILWYPLKNAFLAGRVLITDSANVGVNSFATGYESKAKGRYSQAMGYKATSNGDYSTAIGKNAVADKIHSFAFGEGATASNNESYAIGRGAVASGFRSFAFGSSAVDSAGQTTGVSWAKGEYSFSIGQGSITDNLGSIAIGLADTATGAYSLSMGYKSSSPGYGAVSIGVRTRAEGWNSFASGYETKAGGIYSHAGGAWSEANQRSSIALGENSKSNGSGAVAIGTWTSASGSGSVALGYSTTASGSMSFASGIGSIASGEYSVAMGRSSQASGSDSFAFGLFSVASKQSSIALGYSNSASGVGSAAIGYTASSIGDYSISLGRSTQSQGVGSIAIGFSCIAAGGASVALGSQAQANGSSSVAIGYSTAGGDNSFAEGFVASATGNYSVAMGFGTIASGLKSTAIGPDARATAENSTAFGTLTLASGSYSTVSGTNTTAFSGYETVAGRYNTNYAPASTIGWDGSDRLFSIGNGTSNVYRSNALTILKNGRIGLQRATNPVYALELTNSPLQGEGQAIAYSWATFSDARVKSDRRPLPYGIKEVMLLSPEIYFHHSSNTTKEGLEVLIDGNVNIGLIAQDVYNIIPEAVIKPQENENGLWSISYDKLTPVLVNAIKEQQKLIETQNERIERLERLVEEMQGAIIAGHSK